jgi:hypothetical protein
MTLEQYYLMCEQMGWDPVEDEMPKEIGSLDFTSQTALILFNLLPDNIDSMNGSWLGKDFSSLEIFMNIYEIDNRRDVLDRMFVIHREFEKYYQEKQKAKESRSKNKAKVRK